MAKPAILTVADTLPTSFLLAVETRGGAPAMREKTLGIWKTITWNDWLERAREIAYALDAIGFRPGGVASGIYPTDSVEQVEYLINDSRTRVLFVEDDEQLDKALEVRSRCPTLMQIVIFDMQGLDSFRDPMCVSLTEFLGLGRAHRRGRERLWDTMIKARSPEDLAILVYTSGTTGPPKGAMLSHRNIVTQMRHANAVLSYRQGDERLAFLPMCHVAERIAGAYYSIATGVISNFAENPQTVPENIRELQPMLFGAVPRVWERLYSTIMIALKDATGLERWAYALAIAAGYRIADARLARRHPTVAERLGFAIAYWLVLRNIRITMGI